MKRVFYYKKIVAFCLVLVSICSSNNLVAQTNIVKAEYFIDNDPGFGAAINIPVTAAVNIANQSVAINLSPVAEGFHTMYFRSQDANGKWSVTNATSFFKTGAAANANIVKAEYFIDTDPGFGAAINVPVTAAANIANQSVAINLSSVTAGFHTMYLRSQDANGKWSVTNATSFFKTGAAAISNIVKAEYFIDNDPGFGMGKNISVTAANNLADLNVPVNIGTLPIGLHRLYIRSQSTDGKWSITNTDTFRTTQPPIANMEVGVVPTSLCAGTSFNVPFTSNITYNSGNVFTAQLSSANGSFGTPINIGTFTNLSAGTIAATLPNNVLAGANYRIRVIATNPLDTSIINDDDISIGRVPEQAFTITGDVATCIETKTYSINAPTIGVTYTWALPTGGTISSNTGTNVQVDWTTAGTHTLAVTPSNTCGNGLPVNETVTVSAPNGNPLIFGANQWNVYAYNGSDISLGASNIYRGGYSVNTLNLNSTNEWSNSSSPSAYSSYIGCPVNNDNFIWVYKRKGFAMGNYVINNLGTDDEATIYKNGILLYSNLPVSNNNNLGVLGANDSIEIRVKEVAGLAHANFSFTIANLNAGRIAGNQSGCAGFTPLAFTNTALGYGGSTIGINYQWQQSDDNIIFTDIASATNSTYTAAPTAIDKYFRRKAYNVNGEVAYSDTLNIDITPLLVPSVNLISSDNNVCFGTNLVFTAIGNNIGNNAIYKFKVNNLVVQNSTANTYNSNNLNNGDLVKVEMETFNTCQTSNSTTSNEISAIINTKPVINAGNDITILRGSSTTLSVLSTHANLKYLWSTGDTSNAIIVSPQTTTSYLVSGNNGNGCLGKDTVIVNVIFSNLNLSVSNLNFGEVVKDSSKTLLIRVNNTGTASETINSFSLNSPFFTTISSSIIIAPGGHVDIPIKFTPTSTLLYAAVDTLFTGAGNFAIQLAGKGVNPLASWSISPAFNDYGNVLIGTSLVKNVTIYNSGNINISLNNILFSNNRFNAPGIVLPIVILPTTSTSIPISFSPNTTDLINGTVNFIGSSSQIINNITTLVKGSGYNVGQSPILSLVSNQTVGVSPTVGPSNTVFTYKVKYKHPSGLPPMSGFPKLGFDLNGDGDFIDVGESEFAMIKIGNTTNWLDGEEYVFSKPLSSINNFYGYKFIAKDINGNFAVSNNASQYFGGPEINNQLFDLSIYADNITFSEPNPALNTPFTATATILNNSPYSGTNIKVRFYIDSNFYYQDTIAFLNANSSKSISHTFSKSQPGFYQLKVWIDTLQELTEVNRLNNFAIRPIIVGDFAIPGTILVSASANTQSCPFGAVVISGQANYSGLNLVGNPLVLGATVKVKIYHQLSNTLLKTFQTTTNNVGTWSVYWDNDRDPFLGDNLDGIPCGVNYRYAIEITDYTLTGYSSNASFSIACVECNAPKEYATGIFQPNCILENDNFNISVTTFELDEGRASIFTQPVFRDTLKLYRDGLLLQTFIKDTIPAGGAFSHGSVLQNLPVGDYNYSISNSFYDLNNKKIETFGQARVTVLKKITDLQCAISGIGSELRKVKISAWKNGCYDAPSSILKLYDSSGTTGQKLLIATYNIPNIIGHQTHSYIYENPLWDTGFHHLIAIIDPNNQVEEFVEDNNQSKFSIYIPKADLVPLSLTASTTLLLTGAQVNFNCIIKNIGGTNAQTFKVKFFRSNLQIGATKTISGLAAGETVNVLSDAYTVSSLNCVMLFRTVIDVDNQVIEENEFNNSITDTTTADIQSGRDCFDVETLGSSCDPYRVPQGLQYRYDTEIRNTGNKDITDTIFIRFNVGSTIIGYDKILGLGAGQSKTTGVVYTSNQAGSFVIDVQPNYNNKNCEYKYINNNSMIFVSVSPTSPDVTLLSQHISPSNLNPEIGQPVHLIATVFNKGQFVSKPFKVRIFVDNVKIGDDLFVDTLYPGASASIQATATYSGTSVGPKIVRVFADAENEVAEFVENNNEATRAIIVGNAPDFLPSQTGVITFNKVKFRKGETITICRMIKNRGGIAADARLSLYFINKFGIKALFDTIHISIPRTDSNLYCFNWIVADTIGKLLIEVSHANPMEFDLLNNLDSINFKAGPLLKSTHTISKDTVCTYQLVTIKSELISDGQNIVQQWHQNGIPILQYADSLVITNVGISNQGWYKLVRTDTFGTMQNDSIYLTVNTSNSLYTLAQNKTINGNLNLSTGHPSLGCWPGGKIELGNFDLVVNGNIEGFDDNHFIITNGTGVIKINNTNAENTFPVSVHKDSALNSIKIKNIEIADSFSVRVSQGVLDSGTVGNAISNSYINKTWHISESTSGGSNVTLTLNWQPTNELVSFNRNSCNIAHYFNSSWQPSSANKSAALQPNGSLTISADNINFFSPFSVTSSLNTLALNLTQFSGSILNNDAHLIWKTQNEINNSHFIIERSIDGINFTSIANILAINTINTNQYNFKDINPFVNNNKIYYRLKIVDKNGQYTYSNIVVLTLLKDNQITLFPNPAQNYIILNGLPLNGNLKIYNSTSAEIFNSPISSPSINLNVSKFVNGLYFVQIIINKKIIKVLKFIKQ